MCACIFTFISFSSDAALVVRLGGLADYDTDADLTWLADANAAVGSSYDTTNPGSGLINWADANSWAAELDVAGITGWRLPGTLTPDATCDTQSGGFSTGYNCTGSEMGNLFYNVPGNTAGYPSSTVPFSNVQNGWYWSATPTSGGVAWIFHMIAGDVGAAPLPAALWLFGSGLLGLIGVARRKASR